MLTREQIKEKMRIIHNGESGRTGWRGTARYFTDDGCQVFYDNGVTQDYRMEWFLTNMILEDPKKLPKTFYILWNPCANRPPRKKMYTFGEARKAQDNMSWKHRFQHPHGTFHIMRMVENAHSPTPQDELTPINEDIEMQRVKLLHIEDKIIEINATQAAVLGASGAHYRITNAMKLENQYFEANELTVSQPPKPKTEDKPVKVEIVNPCNPTSKD